MVSPSAVSATDRTEPTPCGAWTSSLAASRIAGGTVRLSGPCPDGSTTYWVESRPAERGRHVLLRAGDDRVEEVTAAPFDVRTRAFEYGGGQYAVDRGRVVFAHSLDQRLYRLDPDRDEHPVPLTLDEQVRYADLRVDRGRGRIVCVREDHRGTAPEPVHSLVAIDLERAGPAGEVLIAGPDFVISPRLSPDGRRLAWLSWDHPRMPWDGTDLWEAELDAAGRPGPPVHVAGGPEESIVQPEYSPDGALHWVSDRSGWWNLWRDGRPLVTREAEFARPAWVFGMSSYGFASDGTLVAAYHEAGRWWLGSIGPGSSTLEPIESPYTEIDELRVSSGEAGTRVVFAGGRPTHPTAIVSLDLGSGRAEELRRESELELDPAVLSIPRPVTFTTEGDRPAHALFYAPASGGHRVPDGERPPLLVMSHGGPTAAASTALNLQIQFWTSRGFAVLDVDYGGSTGYGRAYRRRLEGGWGIVDVDDCVRGALHLVEEGEVDGERLLIRGRSAGGYTTLAGLAFRDVFRAGASYYGVSELESLARDTHKFESRYLDALVGPYPERRDLYLERSPLEHADRIRCPVIFFQGVDDKVVPPAQAEAMVGALRSAGLPVAYLLFEGEGHGFRRAETIERCLEAELSFYGQVLGFEPADDLDPVEIENSTA